MADSPHSDLFATVRNLRLDGWEREVALKRIEEQYEDLTKLYEQKVERVEELSEQYEYASREARANLSRWNRSERRNETLEEQLTAAQERADMNTQLAEQHYERAVRAEEQLEGEQRAHDAYRGELDDANRHILELKEQFESLLFTAERLFQMIPREVWRDQGGDDGQGHYEGDYYAERIEQELVALRASVPAISPKEGA